VTGPAELSPTVGYGGCHFKLKITRAPFRTRRRAQHARRAQTRIMPHVAACPAVAASAARGPAPSTSSRARSFRTSTSRPSTSSSSAPRRTPGMPPVRAVSILGTTYVARESSKRALADAIPQDGFLSRAGNVTKEGREAGAYNRSLQSST